MRGRAFTAILACACLLLPGCPTGSIDPALGPPEPGATQAGSRYTIVTTTGMVTDLVRQIADQVVDVLQFRLIKFGEISDEVILRIFRQELRHELAEDVEARFGEVHRQ